MSLITRKFKIIIEPEVPYEGFKQPIPAYMVCFIYRHFFYKNPYVTYHMVSILCLLHGIHPRKNYFPVPFRGSV